MSRFHDPIHYIDLQISLYIYFSQKNSIYCNLYTSILISSFFDTNFLSFGRRRRRIEETSRPINRPIDLSIWRCKPSRDRSKRWDVFHQFWRIPKEVKINFSLRDETKKTWMHFSTRHIGHRIITPCTEPRKFAVSCLHKFTALTASFIALLTTFSRVATKAARVETKPFSLRSVITFHCCFREMRLLL